MDARKIVVTAGLVTFTLSGVPYVPPPPPRQDVTIVMSGGKFTVIRLDKREKGGGDVTHAHPIHTVGSRTVVSTDSSTMIGGIVVADNTDLTAGAASDLLAVDLNFVAKQWVRLPPWRV